ncbi:MAG: photosystem I reaction center subunit PsaK [Timaviella obliquedivisa GSE-PSE-MK23-08B]|nr:photosystem I reaction center subunit PsaK [Timaviella obliquedivisa GSE-PSE-MK23-08B]
MFTLPLLALLPRTLEWSPTIGIIMLFCNIVAIAIGRFAIQQPNVGPPMPGGGVFGDLSLAAVIGSASLGHVLGAGVILGLSNLGVI